LYPRKIVLASTSPRRVQLLKQLGVDFECFDPNVSEDSITPDPEQRVKENAEKKARSAMRQYTNALIIAADTIVFFEGIILEKPRDTADAIRMITTLSGQTHIVLTAIIILDTITGQSRVKVEKTSVMIKNLTQDEIYSYVLTGEPMDKAGAYAAQGLGGMLLKGIDGCFYNVVGLPLSLLHEMLMDFGVDLLIYHE
jgi:septum formation protein